MKTNVSEAVLTQIAEYFSVPVKSITRATVAKDIAGWDSIANVEIILALETLLDVELEPADLFELKNVGSMIEVFALRSAEKAV